MHAGPRHRERRSVRLELVRYGIGPEDIVALERTRAVGRHLQVEAGEGVWQQATGDRLVQARVTPPYAKRNVASASRT